MIIVYKNENKALLYLAENLLEESGIHCFVKNEHSASVGGSLGMSNTSAELWLNNASDELNALAIIDREITSSTARSTWVCSQCTEGNDGSFDFCWNCQAEAPDI